MLSAIEEAARMAARQGTAEGARDLMAAMARARGGADDERIDQLETRFESLEKGLKRISDLLSHRDLDPHDSSEEEDADGDSEGGAAEATTPRKQRGPPKKRKKRQDGARRPIKEPKTCRGCGAVHNNSYLGVCKKNIKGLKGQPGCDHIVLRKAEYEEQDRQKLAQLEREGRRQG